MGRPYVDQPDSATLRDQCEKGFFVSIDYSRDSLTEIDNFFRRQHMAIIPLSFRDILDEHIARKLV